MRVRSGALLVMALSIAGVPGLVRGEDTPAPADIAQELERMRALHIDHSILAPRPPQSGVAVGGTVDIAPGSTHTFSAPDLAPDQTGECEKSGAGHCFSHYYTLNWTFQTSAGAWGSSSASGQMPTAPFRVPGPAGSRYTATISATAEYGGHMVALAGIGGTARAYFSLSASLFKGETLLQTKVIASEECLARAYGLSGDECGRTFDSSGTADFQVSLEANQTYTVVVRGTAFARALLLSAAWTYLDANEDNEGLFWEQVTVSVEPDVTELLQQTRQEVASIRQDLTEVQAATAHSLEDHHQQLDLLGTSLAMDDQQVGLLASLNDLMQVVQDQTNASLAQTDNVRTKAIESSLLRGEPLIGLYLPLTHGGSLESVRALVAVRIDEAAAIGQNVAAARLLLGLADSAIAQQRYKEALALLAGAYQTLTTKQATVPAGTMP